MAHRGHTLTAACLTILSTFQIIYKISEIRSNTKLRHWKGTKKELFRFYWCHSGGSGYKVWKVRKKYVFTAGLVWYDHGDNNVWYKNLRKWKFHWQVDRRNYKHYDGVPSFLEWIRRNLFSLSNVGEFMMRVHHMIMNGKKFMMGVHHMMQVHHMMRVYSIICMMGIHHTLRIPKASRHLQRIHQ